MHFKMSALHSSLAAHRSLLVAPRSHASVIRVIIMGPCVKIWRGTHHQRDPCHIRVHVIGAISSKRAHVIKWKFYQINKTFKQKIQSQKIPFITHIIQIWIMNIKVQKEISKFHVQKMERFYSKMRDDCSHHDHQGK